MIFYLIDGTSWESSCLVGTQAEARTIARERGTGWEQHDVPTDKAGLMVYINKLRADVSAEMHRDRDVDGLGLDIEEIATRDGAEAGDKYLAPTAPSPIHQSIAIDDEWERLSLARKLHFAALAMEDARSAL